MTNIPFTALEIFFLICAVVGGALVAIKSILQLVDGPATADFLSGLIKSLPPLHDVAGMAGIELPKYLGEIAAAKDKKMMPDMDMYQ